MRRCDFPKSCWPYFQFLLYCLPSDPRFSLEFSYRQNVSAALVSPNTLIFDEAFSSWLAGQAESLSLQVLRFLQHCHLPGIQKVTLGQLPAVFIWRPNLKAPSGLWGTCFWNVTMVCRAIDVHQSENVHQHFASPFPVAKQNKSSPCTQRIVSDSAKLCCDLCLNNPTRVAQIQIALQGKVCTKLKQADK